MKKKASTILIFVLILNLLLVGCGGKQSASKPEGGDSQTGKADKPAVEQILKYGTDSEPAGLDPHTISAAASITIFRHIYDSLIELDEDMNFVPRLAESWEQPDDVTHIFKLREGVKFHNGREMVADDVKYSFERVLNPETAAIGKSYYDCIKTIEVLNDYEVKFVLKEPFAPFMSNLTSLYGAIVPKEVVEEYGDLMNEACGTGPFKLKEWIPDNRIVLEKNEDYFREGKPTLDGIEFYVMTDQASRLAALRTGNIHMAKLPASSIPLVKDNPDIQVMDYQSNDYSYLGFNLDLEKFQDKRVRQAISYAINRQDIIDTVYDGEAQITGFVPPAMGKWAIDYASEDLYQQNIEKAKKLLADAGYPDGFETTIGVGLYDDIRDTGEVLQKQLEAIGIKAEIQNLESGQYIDAWSNRTHEMLAGRNGAGTDPNRAVGFFFSTNGSANVWGYSNPEVDKLVELGKATVDEKEREKVYKEAQQLVLDDCPNLFLVSPMEYFFVRKEVSNFEPSTFYTDYLNIVIE